MHREIDAIDADEFLNTPPDDLVAFYIDEFTIRVPVVQYDQIAVDQGEAKVDVSGDPRRAIFDRERPFYITGTKITFHVPFEGDPELFKCQPSRSYLGNWPSGVIADQELTMTVTALNHDADAVKAQFERELGMVRSYLGWIASDAKEFNSQLADKVRGRISARREKLLADRGLVTSLGYKMRVRPDASRTYAVPSKRRDPPVARPRPQTVAEPFAPEPELAMEEYEYILNILSNMVTVIERSPAAFKRMKEEDLRQHFLVQLNGHYEGTATGETFNFDGKTDILIRADGKNVFIAECKFWRGPKTLMDAVEQLLGYATWRDTKTAILLFNRTKNLSDVLAKVAAVMDAHANHKRTVSTTSETTSRYVFAHRDDPDRELIVTVLVFEVPA